MVTAKLYLAGVVAALIVVLGLTAGLFKYRGDAIDAKADLARTETALASVVAINSANGETIKRLTAYREIDDKLMVTLQGRLTDLATQANAAIGAVRELEKTNATVADFLRSALPDELKRLLNKRPADGNAAGGDSRVAP